MWILCDVKSLHAYKLMPGKKIKNTQQSWGYRDCRPFWDLRMDLAFLQRGNPCMSKSKERKWDKYENLLFYLFLSLLISVDGNHIEPENENKTMT